MALEEQNTIKKSDEGTELAIERTAMASNRTLMAWIRTGLSLISFGFTIYKILQSSLIEKQIALQSNSPRRVGLFLIALGTLSLIFGAIEYFQTLKRLDHLSRRSYKPFNYALFVAAVLALLGIFLFITIVFHREVF